MSGIVCAIRGGPASKSTLRKAIELAQIRDVPLYLLFVINLEFLAQTAHSRTISLEEEMRDMGEMILLMAQESAAAANVSTYPVIRRGEVAEQIIALCKNVDADVVVVGKPLTHRVTTAFDEGKLSQFKLRMNEDCQAALVIVE
jgi:nucleotide-binding universal stress UspA family protein